jgi:hypothetical protein
MLSERLRDTRLNSEDSPDGTNTRRLDDSGSVGRIVRPLSDSDK